MNAASALHATSRLFRGRVERVAPRAQGVPAAQDGSPAEVQSGAMTTGFARSRDHDWPGDREQHHCRCGAEFTSDVSAQTACPVCGSDQPW